MKKFVKRDRFNTYQEGQIIIESVEEWSTLRMALTVAIEQCEQMLEKIEKNTFSNEESRKHWKEMLGRYQQAYDDLDPKNEYRV
ncbi:hypothetical protein [Brevibacillus borstelensis]|uniref:hypothetical protein n=1 Tax=Brevibacillus borstelensis TaxID=45462 RepID=UPI0030F9C1EE